jgi:hypothetical protein
MEYLELLGSVGEDQENDPADIRNTATSLTSVGVERIERAARTGVWDGELDAGIRHFQAGNGLDVDGILLPDGPTQSHINRTLGESSRPYEPAGATRSIASSGRRDFALARPSFASAEPHDADQDTPSLAREDRMIARGYRYRSDPMGRLGEGEWVDGLGRPIETAEVRWRDRSDELPLSTGHSAESRDRNADPTAIRRTSPELVARGADPFDNDGAERSVADGGQAFIYEWLRAAIAEDFADSLAQSDAIENGENDVGGVEPAGFRDWIAIMREAFRRGLARTAKIEPKQPPRPPAGSPPLPASITGRLDFIENANVRNAADRLLDGARIKGWVPGKIVSPEPAQLAKDGGKREALQDFAHFVGRAGGTKHDIKVSREGKAYTYIAPDKTTITYRSVSADGLPTNELLVTLPKGLAKDGRGGMLQIKIRYE